MSMRDDYRRIMTKAWAGAELEPPTFNQARSYMRAYFKRHTGRRLNREIRESHHVDGMWRGSGKNTGTLVVNPRSGWFEINHSMSHYVNHVLGRRPHCDRHMELERDGALLIRRRWGR